MNEFEKLDKEGILKIQKEDEIEIIRLNNELYDLELSQRCIEINIDKLEQYIKSGEGKLIFDYYIDVNKSRERQIENKLEAQPYIDEMTKLVQDISKVLSVKNKRYSDLFGEIYDIFSENSKEKNELRKELKRRSDERFNLNQGKENSIEKKENDKAIKVKIRSLPLKQKEKLQTEIIKWIENFLDDGEGSQEQAYIQLALKSKDELGYQLTKGQIEGQHKRHLKEFRQQ